MSNSLRAATLATISAIALCPAPAAADSTAAAHADLVAGGEHTCVLGTDGVARCWGSHEFGTLLTHQNASLCGTTRRPAACVRTPVPLGNGGWSDLALGSETICGLRQGGEVQCWGRDWLGTLGRGEAPLDECTYDLGEARDCSLDVDTGQVHCADLGHHEMRTAPCSGSPAPVQGLPPATALLGVGPAFCALTPDLYCWGADEANLIPSAVSCNDYYHCTRTARAVPTDGRVLDVGHAFDTMVLEDGRVERAANSSHSSKVQTLTAVSAIATARYWGCAVTGEERSVQCWGAGSHGQLGGGPMSSDLYGVVSRQFPVKVLDLTGVTKLLVDSLGNHACALRDDGTLWCWGRNGQGQLGLGDTEDRWQPTQVPGLSTVVDAAVGSLHTCALVESGDIYCWGVDHLGQVGHSDRECALDYVFDPGPAPCQLSPFKSYPR